MTATAMAEEAAAEKLDVDPAAAVPQRAAKSDRPVIVPASANAAAGDDELAAPGIPADAVSDTPVLDPGKTDLLPAEEPQPDPMKTDLAAASAAPEDPMKQDLGGAGEEPPLQLEVSINGVPLKVIAAFVLLPGGKIGSMRSELAELGIAAEGDGPAEEVISLESIAGLTYSYDEEAQTIAIDVPDSARQAKVLDGIGDGEIEAAVTSTGAVLNYTAYGAASYNIRDDIYGLNGGSLSLDARAFSRFGTLQQTGVIGTTTFDDMTIVRHDTIWSYSDEKRALTYQLGDIISGGLGWTRPVRMGGGQVHRNFDLRPDLITMPVPQVEGSAKVPSTIDVYIDGLKAYSGGIQEGPFRLDSLPVFTTDGTVRVVLTDTTGREVVSESDFSTSPDLLKHDLYDFSVDAGVMRRDFGVDSFGYEEEPVGLASLRYGLTDWLTGEAHAEGSMKLISGGAGFLASGGRFGLFSGAVAGSYYEGDAGMFVQAGWEGRIGDFGVVASTSRTFGQYEDLAAISSIDGSGRIDPAARVPKALDRLSVTYSFEKLKAGIGASFIHRETADGKTALLLSGSYSQTLFDDIMMSASAFADFGDEHELGAFISLSIPLGETMNSTAGASYAKDTLIASADVSKPFNDSSTLPTAWRVSHSEGDSRITEANGAVRFNAAQAEGMIVSQNGTLRANATLEGSLVMADGSVMAGRKINDSFAIVNAGAKDVLVEYENRPAGRTGSNGKLLLPQLNSFHKNKIAIDVEGLPLNADVGETEMIVVPRDKAGVVVDFGVKADESAALVVLADAAGKFLAEGTEVYLEGAAEPFIVGYDGQAYLTGIASSNDITAKYKDTECHARFAFKPNGEAQTMIGPVPCI